MAKPRLLVARPVPDAVTARARADFDADPVGGPGHVPPTTLVAHLTEHRADALFFSSNLKLERRPDRPSCPASVRVAATCSVGFDHIDVPAAKARGLVVTNTPEVLTDCTADMAFLLLLNACRRAKEYHARSCRPAGAAPSGCGRCWAPRPAARPWASSASAASAAPWPSAPAASTCASSTPTWPAPPQSWRQGAEWVPNLRDLLPRSQILTLHAPGGAATDKPDEQGNHLALLPRGAVLVNAARGTLVDEDALIEALQSRHLFAAGLDVFRSEPDFDQRLSALPNVFLTPHMGSATLETRNAMGFRALDNIAAVTAGKPPIDPLWS